MKDNFSGLADIYAKYRPHYPAELFIFILSNISVKETAWDCATGNGQTAKDLAPHFKKVFATDISQKQLDHAPYLPNVIYAVQPAEQTDFPPDSFDLVTVSQALHWFRFDDFYKEVKRVLKPGGWIAAWTYSGVQVSPEIDERIKKILS
ncbi:MAG: class I SAM-dependent methyltransferase [Bacteroidota bacterium]